MSVDGWSAYDEDLDEENCELGESEDLNDFFGQDLDEGDEEEY